MFMAVRTVKRMEQERHEQEATARGDAQLKELDALYRIAREESASKKAEAVAAREETRRKLLEVDAARKHGRELMESKKVNLAYLQHHLAVELIKNAYAFLQDPTYGDERTAAVRSPVKERSKTKLGIEAAREFLYPIWDADARSGYRMITPTVDRELKGKFKGRKEWASEKTARAVFFLWA